MSARDLQPASEPIDAGDAKMLSIVARTGSLAEANLYWLSPDPAGPKNRLQSLQARGLVDLRTLHNTDDRRRTEVIITEAGRVALADYNARDHRAPSRTFVASASSGTYTGAELRPFSGRAGAMDAFGIPSLISGQRVPHLAAPKGAA